MTRLTCLGTRVAGSSSYMTDYRDLLQLPVKRVVMNSTPARLPMRPSRHSESTPVHLQHEAIARLRGSGTGSHGQGRRKSRSSMPDSDNVYSTPRSYSAGAESQAVAGTPRTPLQGTPTRRKGAVRIIQASRKPWYARWAMNTSKYFRALQNLTDDARHSFPDWQACLARFGIDTSSNSTSSSSRISTV